MAGIPKEFMKTGGFSEDLNKFNSEEEIGHLFESWKKYFKREYQSPEEEAQRFNIFRGTVKYVKRHNAKRKSPYDMGLGLTQFSDMTDLEFRRKSLGFRFMRNRDMIADRFEAFEKDMCCPDASSESNSPGAPWSCTIC